MQKGFSVLTTARILMLGVALSSQSAFAAKFHCTLVELVPVGAVVDSNHFKGFDFDSGDVPADTIAGFNDLRVSLQSDGKFIKMKLSDQKHTSVASVSSYESEIRTMIDEKAEAYCVTRDVLDKAVSIQEGLR